MIAVRTKVVSQNISLPELEDYIGKEVVITIDEAYNSKNMKDFFDCVLDIEIDESIIEEIREKSLI